MRNIVAIKTKITNFQAIQAACKRLKLAELIQGEVMLFDRIA